MDCLAAETMTGCLERGRPSHLGDDAFAALDLGTNNCRMLVGVPARDGFRVIDSFSRIVRLGEGLQSTGRLSDAAIERAIDALHCCAVRLKRRPISGIRAVATEACRQAANGEAFLDRVQRETGLAFQVITAREEALLALESCAPLIAPAARRALLFDIGGGSTELAWVRLDGDQRPHELIGCVTLPIGVIGMSERYGEAGFGPPGFNDMVAEVQGHLSMFDQIHCIAREARQGGVQFIGTSGTVTTLAGVALNLPRYRRPLIDGTRLSAAAADTAMRLLRALGREGLSQHPCVGPERVDFVMPGCAVFQAIRDTWPMPEVTVADRGLREGMLLRMMRQSQQGRAKSLRPSDLVSPV